MQVTKLLLFVMVLSSRTWSAYAASMAAPTSVREAVAHRIDLDGKVVEVRGLLAGGPHGGWLQPSGDCDYALVTRSVAWPNIIFLNYPNNSSPDPTDHAPFAVDWKAVRAAEDRVRLAGFDPRTDREVATYIGLFVTYRDLDSRVTPGVPGALRLGFGPLLGAPAKLLVKSVKDVVVVRNTGGAAPQ
jgi:hypothetical protein